MTKTRSHSVRAHRAGFTILELFVVIGVIAILMAIAVPAVQQVRASARLVQCRAHLKEIGEALHNFESFHGTLPAGCDFKEFRLHSWNTRILPFLDQSALYNEYDWNASWDDSTINSELVATNLPVFRCPAAISNRSGETDYGGNLGSSQTGLVPGLLLEQAWEAGALIGINVGGPRERKDLLRLDDFTDGTSQTFLVLECADREIENGSWGVGTNCLAIEFPINDRSSGRVGETVISYHSGGGLALYADGHVVFLNNSTDLRLLGSLSTRSRGEVVEAP